MKSPRLACCVAIGCAFVASTTLGLAADRIVINVDEPAPAPKATAKPAPAQPATPKATTKKTDKKEEPKIEGMTVQRGDRGYLGVAIKGGVFKISFYDKDKKPIAADVSGAALRWPVHYQPNDERTYLTPSSDGKSLTSDRVVKPPYSFKLYITLLKATDDGQQTPVETYIIDFSQAEG